MTPGELTSATEVVKQARSLPNGQVRYGIPTRGAYRLVDPSAALPASTDGDDRTRLEGRSYCRTKLPVRDFVVRSSSGY
jgi:hypothetical protein